MRRFVSIGKSLCLSSLLGIGLFVLYIGVKQGMRSTIFEVKEIRWSGLSHLKGSNIKEDFETLTGKNLFQLDLAKVRQKLLLDPWVKTVTVRKVFPDHLVIGVVERKPALVEYAGVHARDLAGSPAKAALLDEEGVVLEEGGVYPETLPRVTRFNRERFPKVAVLARSLGRRRDVLMDLSNPDDLLVYFTGEGREAQKGILHLGKKDYLSRWVRYLEIENDLQDRGFSSWEVDLRFENKVIVKDGLLPKKMSSMGQVFLPLKKV